MTRQFAYTNLQKGLVNESDFDIENRGKSAANLFQKLQQDFNEDLVFTHCDYSFPNIICHGSRVSGVVDLGRAGIADRYQDISLFLRSFKFNFGNVDLKLFLNSYKLIDDFDENKKSFYKKLDEFFLNSPSISQV